MLRTGNELKYTNSICYCEEKKIHRISKPFATVMFLLDLTRTAYLAFKISKKQENAQTASAAKRNGTTTNDALPAHKPRYTVHTIYHEEQFEQY